MFIRIGLSTCLAFTILALSGCLLSRPDEPGIRYVEPTTHYVGGSSAVDVPFVRLAPVSAADHLLHAVMFERGGELQPSREWQWASPPDVYLDRALRLGAREEGVALADSTQVPSVRVHVVAFHLRRVDASEGPPSYALEGAATVEIRNQAGEETHVFQQHSVLVSGELAAVLPGQAGEAIDALVAKIWSLVAAEVSR